MVRDRATGTYADHARVRTIDFVGKYYKSRGPLNTVRPQGHPVLRQAGLTDHERMRPANLAFRASLTRERGRLEDRVELGSLCGAKIDTKIRSACARLPGLARIGESLPARGLGQGQSS